MSLKFYLFFKLKMNTYSIFILIDVHVRVYFYGFTRVKSRALIIINQALIDLKRQFNRHINDDHMYTVLSMMDFSIFFSGDPVPKKTPMVIARAGQQLQMACPISGYPIFNINWEKGKKKNIYSYGTYYFFL